MVSAAQWSANEATPLTDAVETDVCWKFVELAREAEAEALRVAESATSLEAAWRCVALRDAPGPSAGAAYAF